MSAITICSRHKGELSVPITTPEGKDLSVSVFFQGTREPGVFVAEISDELVIKTLLDVGEATGKRTGNPDFWKPGATDGAKKTDDPPPPAEITALDGTPENYALVTSGNQLKTLLEAVTDSEIVMKLIALEVSGQNRSSYNAALEKRLAALKPKE